VRTLFRCRAFQLAVTAGFLASLSTGIAQEPMSLSVLPPNGFQFSGKWNCQGSFRGGKVHESAFAGDVILDGKWIELTEQDTVPATGYVAKYLIGYDPEQKRLVEFDANNFGAATYASNTGWRNQVLTMTSPLSSNPKASYVLNRFQYTIQGKDAFIVDWQISRTATPDWIPADHLVCKRALPQ
jgi:hypothetical protein